ncbi:MAG: PEP/pyruvate-binding domain-containing protein [Acidimicrobiales bacterium]
MSTDVLLELGDPRCDDPRLAGAKAARLSRAGSAGFPVLPGFVVAEDAGREVGQRARVALRRGGSGAARLAAMEAPVDPALLDACVERVRALGPPVVVRSSSVLEGESAWSGAFSSFDDVDIDDLATALRGVWASAFTVAALQRFEAVDVDPGRAGLAVLIQPQVEPRCSGTARVGPDDSVEIVATLGAPRALLGGWDPGVRARVDGGAVVGENAIETFGADVLVDVATLARDVATRFAANLIEWAAVDGRVVLLQVTAAAAPAVSVPSGAPPLDDPLALRVARAACRAPGPLGEALVMPWALGVDRLPGPSAAPPSPTPVADLSLVTRWAEELTKQAWQARADSAVAASAALIGRLRGPDPAAAFDIARGLRPVDAGRAARLLAALDAIAAAAERTGVVPHGGWIWRFPPAELARLLAGDVACPDLAAIGAVDRWEPFVHAAVSARGRQLVGEPASTGIAAGRVRVAGPHEHVRLAGREVIVTERPVPALAPLLWSASALVATNGNTAAHLLEVARSLGVPAVVGVDLASAHVTLAGLRSARTVAAVDGDRGVVAFVDG